VQPLLSTKETHLSKDSRALCDQVRTIDKRRNQETVGVLGHELMAKIDRGLILHLELEEYVEISWTSWEIFPEKLRISVPGSFISTFGNSRTVKVPCFNPSLNT
jgi:hypothetical protein